MAERHGGGGNPRWGWAVVGRLLIGLAWLALVVLAFLWALHEAGEAEWLPAFGFFMAALGIGPIGLLLADRRTAALAVQTDNDSLRRVTESFTQAMGLLGHAEEGVRQGGIHALERIAADNPGERQKIMNILAGYVRSRSAAYADRAFAAFGLMEKAKLNRDDRLLQARLLREAGMPSLTPLFVLDMLEDAAQNPDLNMSPEEVQREVYVRVVREYVLPGSPMPVDLAAALAAIRRLRPRKVEEALDLSHAYLYDADFSGMRLAGVNLSRTHAQGCKFEGATLSGARLRGASLPRAGLAEVDLQGADLEGALLEGATLQEAKLQGAILREATLWGANLGRAQLQGANLWGANLRGADLQGADLQDASLLYADLRGANLEQAQNLSQEQIGGARGDERTKLPQGLHRPENWGTPSPA